MFDNFPFGLCFPSDMDVSDPDEKSIMTYVAQFLQYSNNSPSPDDDLQVSHHLPQSLSLSLSRSGSFFFTLSPCVLFSLALAPSAGCSYPLHPLPPVSPLSTCLPISRRLSRPPPCTRYSQNTSLVLHHLPATDLGPA